RPSLSARRRSERCIRRRPQVSGAESPMEPKMAWPGGGAKPPRVSLRAGSIEKRSGSSSHSGTYSTTTVSLPRTRLLLAKPTLRVRPSSSMWTSKSAIVGSGGSLEADVFGELCAGQRLSDWVVADVGDLAQTVEQAERLEYAGIYSDAYIGVPGFNFLER